QSVGQKARSAAAAIVSATRQTRRHDGGPLCPCQTVQAPPAAIALPARTARPPHSRHRPQDRQPAAASSAVSMAADTRQTNPLAAATPARLEALFLPCPRGRVHRQG